MWGVGRCCYSEWKETLFAENKGGRVIRIQRYIRRYRKTTKCDFFGQIIMPEGMKIDDKKVEVIKQMKAPKTRKLYTVSRNGHLFETLLSQVDEAIRTTPTAASGRNRLDLGLFPSRGLRCHQRRTLHDPSTRVLWPESRTRYSYWRFHERIGCRIATRRKTSDVRIQNSHCSRRGTLFQHREEIARNGVRHGQASQLYVWWTSQSSNRSQTSRNYLEEEYCHCQYCHFFWGLQDTKFKLSTSAGRTTQLQTPLVE